MALSKGMATGAVLSGIGLLSTALTTTDVPAAPDHDHPAFIDPNPETFVAKVKELPFQVRVDHLQTETKKGEGKKEKSTGYEDISWEMTYSNVQYETLLKHVQDRFPTDTLLQGSKSATDKSKTVEISTVQDDDVEEISPSFAYPVADPEYTSHFGMRNGRHHNGVDIVSKSKTLDIYAAKTGTVVASYRHPSGLGNLIIIDHGNGWETYYGHLKERYVKEGDIVKAGDVIGVMGSTGNSTGVHLHFEIRKNNKPLNPKTFLRGA